MSVKRFELGGRVALITGSSSGIGLSIARGLAEAGARVVLNGRNPSRLDYAVNNLKESQLEAYGYAFDVTESKDVIGTIPRIEDEVGPIDILVNNAGIQRRGDLSQIEEDAWREVIDTNLNAAFLVGREVAKGMIDRSRGKIINVCSLMSEVGRSSTGAYAAAKGGLKMLTKAMAVDWAQYDIQVNGIGPGYFLTKMTKPLADDPNFDSWLKRRTPAERWGNIEELIGPAVFLASPASSFVNGQILYVDGGILASL